MNCSFYNLFFFTDEPDAPEKPVVTDWDENFVELQWEQPKTDGGSPVTEFTIQKKERGSPYWVNATTVPGRDTKVDTKIYIGRILIKLFNYRYFFSEILGENSRFNKRTRIRI